MDVQLTQNTPAADKISAYYSLVFPTITYYLQTPNVTIGRRCIPPNSPSSSTAAPQIDIDLGTLKSVSRLHANIEYDETEERWVLAVHGRNGAWVDGVWIQPGKRAPLNERSQIQIASRTFHFELPPPPDTPPVEDMPSPATSHVSLQRERSPSVDITSISPDSSIPSCSPPPPPPHPVPDEKPRPAPGRAESAGKNAKSQPNPKKRKKSDIEVPIVRPEVMPPKPPYTYAQLCYRAIKVHGGKATLQDIIGWMIDSFEWYKYNVGSGWENSVRHNLSSGKTFKKMERSQGERGKGYYWSIDENYEHIVLEQDAKLEQTLSAANREKAKKNKGPLPPPLTSQPLASKTATNPNGSLTSTFRALPVSTATVVKVEHTNQPFANHTLRPVGPGVPYPSVPTNPLPATYQIPHQLTPGHSNLSQSTTGGKAPGIPAIVRIPIIVGPVPDSYVPTATSELSTPTSPHLPTPPIVLHENTLILNPTIFGHLTTEQLKGLETLGAQKALEILQGYIVRFLKERIKTGSGKGRGKGGARGRGRGRGGQPSTGTGRPQVKGEGEQGAAKHPTPVSQLAEATNPFQPVKPSPAGDGEDVLVDIEGDTDDTERANKRRRMDDHAEMEAGSDSSASSATVVPRQGSPPMASLA